MTELNSSTWTRESPVSVKAGRLTVLDGARGYLLVMMFVSHLTSVYGTPLFWFHHGEFSAVMDAEFFIPLSGFVCAISYARPFRRAGAGASALAVLKRLRWLYVYQVAVALMVFALVWTAWPDLLVTGVTPDFETSARVQVLQVMTFARQPHYLDILLIYMLLMLFIPVAQLLLFANRVRLFFGILASCWLFSRLGLDDQVLRLLYTQGVDTRPYFSLAGFFNPLSYALLFYGGFYLGHRFSDEGLAGFRADVVPVSLRYFVLACVIIIGFAIADLLPGVPGYIHSPARDRYSEVALCSTLAIAYAVYFLLNQPALPEPIASLRSLISGVFRLPALVMIGQNSLFFYSLHVVMVYLASYAIAYWNLGHSLLALLGVQIAVVASAFVLTALKKRLLPGLP
ncbi:OpgC domain-containing protein [Hyphomonas sp.]|uniref:OpgC domain-containing protein n=1 Tax=Hyphomonas sp. TaxID=87 RepID=UPI0025B9C6B6|nr:OpgC domain-containing protein [Hyphomonas sp.]